MNVNSIMKAFADVKPRVTTMVRSRWNDLVVWKE